MVSMDSFGKARLVNNLRIHRLLGQSLPFHGVNHHHCTAQKTLLLPTEVSWHGERASFLSLSLKEGLLPVHCHKVSKPKSITVT